MTEGTATIRVARRTRDLLARQARRRGVSIASMLTELAERAERAAIFESECAATHADAESAAVRAEERDWEAVLGDGIG